MSVKAVLPEWLSACDLKVGPESLPGFVEVQLEPSRDSLQSCLRHHGRSRGVGIIGKTTVGILHKLNVLTKELGKPLINLVTVFGERQRLAFSHLNCAATSPPSSLRG